MRSFEGFFLLVCDRMGGGSVAEWLKAHDSKSCRQKCLGGSNPLASAKIDYSLPLPVKTVARVLRRILISLAILQWSI